MRLGHLEKLTFSERANWMRERHAGFVARDRNESARFLRPRRALSRSRCQEGSAGCPERGRALGGLPCAVERGLAQAGRGAEDRGGSVRARASKYNLCFRTCGDVPSRGFQDGQHRHGAAEELESAAIGGNVLVVAGGGGGGGGAVLLKPAGT